MASLWPIRRVAFRYPLMVLLSMLVGSLALSAFGVRGPGQTGKDLEAWPMLDMWVRWDAGWYVRIALEGYDYSNTHQSSVAFFPVYPLLLRAMMALTGLTHFVAGMVVTWVMGFIAVLTFSTWAAHQAGVEAASRATWLLLVWPFALYLFGAVYSDATFLVWASTAFLLVERRQVALATLCGALATATRPVAPAMVLGLLVRNLELRRREGPLRVRDFLPLGAGLGLASYMAFLWYRFGDPLGFATTQVGWNQLSGLDSLIKVKALSKYEGLGLAMPAFHFALSCLCLWLGVRMRKTLGLGYTVYVVLAVGLSMLASRDFTSMGRYAIAGFPVFVQLDAELGTLRRRVLWALVSASLLVVMLIRFAVGRSVA